jgi:protein-tyrosine phosphatase
MRYAVHTLSFDECSELQKAWALYTAGRCSDRIMQIVDGQKRLRLDTVPAEFTGGGRLSMTILPGRRDYSRNLADDLATMRDEGVDAVACLVPVAEMGSYGVPELLDRYNDEQIECYHLPIADQRACTRSDAVELVQWCRSHLDAGRHVMLHCVGGIGRTGLIAACVLKAYGLDSEAAINFVRNARTRRAIETPQQEAFVREFSLS